MTQIKAVLFDLDGTLLDTAQDLGIALNYLRQEHQLPILSLKAIRPAAGSGCKGLLKLGLNIDPHDERYPELSIKLLDYYQKHLIDTTHFFPGMEETLSHLDNMQIPWGIVTNKPAKFTDQIVAHLHLDKRAGCIISGDSLAHRKPHPEPILHGCRQLQHRPEECLYIGDSEVDILACKAAGSPSLAALYGYIPRDENPQTWGADGFIQHPAEILDWIKNSL
ncbi:MAG: HAD-IA family hydrolase [Gammaproteobacteria bacterium]